MNNTSLCTHGPVMPVEIKLLGANTAHRLRAIVSGSLGNLVEWYD